MSFLLLNKVAAVTSSPAIKLARGVKDHTVEIFYESRAITIVSAVVVKLQGSIGGADRHTGVVDNPTLAIDTTADRYSNVAFNYRINGVSYNVIADAAGQEFSAAHVIGNGADNLYGAIGIYIDSAGAFSSRVPISPQVYTTAELALDALEAMAPAADSLCPVGKILIYEAGGTFTANTTAMTGIATFISSISTFFDLQTYTLSAAELIVGGTMFHVVNKSVGYIRAYVSTLTGAGEVSVRYTPEGV